jgi:predicted permease
MVGLRGERRRTFGVATGLQNYGFIPLPILASLFDGQTIAVHLMHTLGVEIALWTAAVMLLTGGKAGGWRNLFNAPLLTTVACIGANALLRYPALPTGIGNAVGMLSACAIPISLLLIGATIRDLLRAPQRAGADSHPLAEGAAAVAVRLMALPALMLLFAKFVPMPIELQRVLVVQAAMPGAVFPIILARRYGGDTATAVRVAMVTTLVSVVTIPPVIIFGLWWTGAIPSL